MSTSKEEIGRWFDEGVKQGATHMIVVCDTYDWEDYPVYVMPNEDAYVKYNERNGENMQRVMEVYNLKINKKEQLKENRTFNF